MLAVGLVWAADPSEALTQVPQEVKQGQGTPKKEHQFVWSLSPWTGKEFGGSFAPRQVDTIYLLADETNIMNSLRSEIYFWEITQEYMADWFGTKEEVDGTLEILKGNTVFKTVEKIPLRLLLSRGLLRQGRTHNRS